MSTLDSDTASSTTSSTKPSTTSPPAAGRRPFASGSPSPAPGPRRHRARPGRAVTVAVLIGGLVLSGVARFLATGQQAAIARTSPYYVEGAAGSGNVTGTKLAGMDSFLLALLLGGLRGPLVMFLWASSESQKNERDLEDFDSKVELIRMLQPEFDTVHIFQQWNKAYNISAQLASLPHKYVAILDAIDYLKNVDAERPNNVNILLCLSQLYGDKLGGTANDKEYYIRRVREETKYRPPAAARPGGTIRNHLDPILGKDGNVLPDLARPVHPRPGSLPTQVVVPDVDKDAFLDAAGKAGVTVSASQMAAANKVTTVTLPESDARKVEAVFTRADVRYIYADWNTGAELQYLEQYGPYPYGVSPLGLGYNYAKRAQVLMALNGQRPLQFSTGVLDSRPGLSLRQWAEDESQRAIEAELRAFGKEVKEATSVTNRPGLELPTAAVPATQPLPPAALADVRQAIFQYRMAERLCRDAKNEYARHLNNPDNLVNKYQDYSSHIDHLSALEFVSAADADYLEAMLPGTPEATRRQLWERAAVNYRNAVTWYEYLDLRYYVPGETREKWLPAGATPATLLNYRREATTLADFKQGPVRVAILQMTRVYDRVMWDLRGIDDQNQTERQEYDKYLKRASGRLRQLLQIPSVSAAGADAASDTAPPTQPSETQPATPGTPGAQPATAPATQPLGPALAPAGPNVRRPVTTN